MIAEDLLDLESEFAKKYLLLDIEQEDFFREHTQKAKVNTNGSYGIFDTIATSEILNNYFNALVRVMQNPKLPAVQLGFAINGDIVPVCNMTKQKFVNQVIKLHAEGRLDGVQDIESKVQMLVSMASLDKVDFAETHTVLIDGQKISFPTHMLVDFILQDHKKFDLQDENLQLFGYDKNIFFYALKTFSAEYQIKYSFLLTDDSKAFLRDVVEDIYANTVHFNRLNQTNDQYLLETQISDDLRAYVFDGMPKDYSTLEKAIYIYIKLCKKLTYDPEFYANNQSGMVARKHEDISRLATITTKQTRVVCYEFAQIYAKFLFELGLNYEIDGGMSYGDGHADLKFRIDEFVINADSVTQILGGDLYNAKINSELEGIQCDNVHKPTVSRFEDAYDRVYDYIIRTEQTQESDESKFDEFLDMFDALCEKEQVTMQAKRRIFEKRCKEIQLPTMDKITYVLNLAKSIFAKERNKCFNATIISKKEINGFNISTVPIIIFAFNEEGFKQAPIDTQYMLMDSNGNLEEISKETISQNFQLGVYKHISAGVKDRHTIPGIDSEVSK